MDDPVVACWPYPMHLFGSELSSIYGSTRGTTSAPAGGAGGGVPGGGGVSEDVFELPAMSELTNGVACARLLAAVHHAMGEHRALAQCCAIERDELHELTDQTLRAAQDYMEDSL